MDNEPNDRTDTPADERGRPDAAFDPADEPPAQDDLIGYQDRTERRNDHAEQGEPIDVEAPHAGNRCSEPDRAENQREQAHLGAHDMRPTERPVVKAVGTDGAEVHDDEDDHEDVQDDVPRPGEDRGEVAARGAGVRDGTCGHQEPAGQLRDQAGDRKGGGGCYHALLSVLGPASEIGRHGARIEERGHDRGDSGTEGHGAACDAGVAGDAAEVVVSGCNGDGDDHRDDE